MGRRGSGTGQSAIESDGGEDMGSVTVGIIVIIGIILLALLGITAVLAIVMGLGWVLTQVISDFSLFEATVLIILAGVVASALFDKLFDLFRGVDTDEYETYLYPFEDDPDNTIVIDRFAETADEFDGEAYFRYQIANAIFDDLDALPRTTGLSTQRQVIELSIRLTDPVVSILKRRKKRVNRVTINVNAMKKELGRMGLKPYDNDILEAAVSSVNELLEEDERAVDIVNDNGWDDFLM